MPEGTEVSEMGIHDELKREGFKFEYERYNGEDRTEVWTNEKAGMAVRIEWLKVNEVAGDVEARKGD